MELAINIKNKTVYKILNDNVINCTNSNDNTRMVLYKSFEVNDELTFAREYDEFKDKFIIKNESYRLRNDGAVFKVTNFRFIDKMIEVSGCQLYTVEEFNEMFVRI